MSSEQPPAAPPPGGSPRRRPPTIELSAEEARMEPSAGPGSGAAEQSAPPRHRPSMALLAGVAAGAVIVLGTAALFALLVGGERALEARLTRAEQGLRDFASRPVPERSDGQRLDELAGHLSRVESAIAGVRPAAPDPALANRIATLEGEIKAIGEKVAIMSGRSDEIATTARDGRQRAEATAAALAELSQRMSRPDAPALQRRDFEALTSRVVAVERATKLVETELAKRSVAAGRDQAVRLAMAAAALESAVERGEPFTAELAAVQALTADPASLAALDGFAASGVPSVAALARELVALVPALDTAAGAPPRDGGILDKLQANAEKLVRIRPLEAAPGTDAAAIVARIEVKATRGDLAGALAELEQLPANVRAPAEAWIKKAQTRAAAVNAGRRLAADALARLRQ